MPPTNPTQPWPHRLGAAATHHRSSSATGDIRRTRHSTLRRQSTDGLGFATRMRSEQPDEPSTEQLEEVDHPGKATALLRRWQPD
jgi:hypothetical protein